MIFLKTYFVSTTKEVDFIPVIHDIQFAIRDSQVSEGLATINIPGGEAVLLVASEEEKEKLQKEFKSGEGLFLTSLSIPFQKKELLLEYKQMVYLVDKSPSARRREFQVQILGEEPKQGDARGGQPRRGKSR